MRIVHRMPSAASLATSLSLNPRYT